MTSKERVIKTLKFEKPDRIPIDFWTLPATKLKYGDALDKLIKEANLDILSAPNQGFGDLSSDPRHYEIGSFVDTWGSGWEGRQRGIVGEVKRPVLDDIRKIYDYKTPKHLLPNKESQLQDIRTFIDHHPDHFILGGWIIIFERMQFVRGTINLYLDILEESKEFFMLRDMIEDYYTAYLDMILKTDIDAVVLADDWGSQRSLLISPDSWRKLFKPVYQRLINRIKSAGKFVFMHSDGYIYDLYDELVEIGIDAVNSQVWCMGVEKVSEKCKGRITFWGELCRQQILPHGSVKEIETAIGKMRDYLYADGGLIGQSEPGPDTPLVNIEASLKWNK